MPATFAAAIDQVLEHEGILAENKHDPGGVTKYGISLRWLQTQGLLGDIDGDGDIDADDVRALTRTQAIELYRLKFWLPGYEKLAQPVATKVFDLAVNAGHSRAHRILQEALYDVGWKLTIDGALGPATIHACGSSELPELLQEFRASQSTFYARLVIKKPTLEEFLKGWMRRAAR